MENQTLFRKKEAPKAKFGDFELSFEKRTHIMGVLNVTPDSFSDGGRYLETDDAIRRAYEMIHEGADIIDIGGQSSRSGAAIVPEKEEIGRVIPVIEKLAGRINIPISIDTSNHKVADMALKSGAVIINDISGLKDDKMAEVAAKHKAGVVIMHMQGTPQDMQISPKYDNVVREILEYLTGKIEKAKNSGIDNDKIIIDPGIGFGKNVSHNLEILRSLKEFKTLGKPLLLGVSRKSFIGRILNTGVDKRLYGTLAASVISVQNGANILRVHDIRAVKEAIQVVDAVKTGIWG